MQRTLLAALSATMTAIIAAPALAHAGDHTNAGFWGNLVHFMTNPDHLVPLAAAAGVIAIYVTKPAVVMRALRALTRRQPK
jgi:HupE / UreJ protein